MTLDEEFDLLTRRFLERKAPPLAEQRCACGQEACAFLVEYTRPRQRPNGLLWPGAVERYRPVCSRHFEPLCMPTIARMQRNRDAG